MNDMAQGLKAVFSRATERMDLISENLANSNTPGYRAGNILPKNFIGELQDRLGGHQWRVGTDLTPGSIRQTDRPLDFALQGDGFFVLDSPNGQFLTRNGSFQITPDGTLTSAAGYPVLGEDGRPFQFPAGTALQQLQVGEEGEISAEGERFGRLRVERVESESHLRRVGTTLFSANPEHRLEDRDTRVVGRSLESANTTVYQEMADMMVLTRSVEAAQRAQSNEKNSQIKMMNTLA